MLFFVEAIYGSFVLMQVVTQTAANNYDNCIQTDTWKKSRKHAANVLKLTPLDTHQRLSKSHKPESRITATNYPNQNDDERLSNPWELDPRAYQKMMVEIYPKNSAIARKQLLKTTPKY